MATPEPATRRRNWTGWALMLALVIGGQVWASERQRHRDARIMTDAAEVRVLVWWAAMCCDSQ